jgi:hypothetical protein
MTPVSGTANFTRLLPPHRIMTMPDANQRMRNFMQNGIANMICLCVPHIMPRQ